MATGDPPICSNCRLYIFGPFHECSNWNVWGQYTVPEVEKKMSTLGILARQKVLTSATVKADKAYEKLSVMIMAKAEQGYSNLEVTTSSLELFSEDAISGLIARLEAEDISVTQSIRETNPVWAGGGVAGAAFIGGTILGSHVSTKETFLVIRW